MNKKFKVFYRHPDGGFRYIATVTVTSEYDIPVTNQLAHVYYKMQGEVWSPNGEAREMIECLGVEHTSMSIGDIAVDEETGYRWRVAPIGWEYVEIPCQ